MSPSRPNLEGSRRRADTSRHELWIDLHSSNSSVPVSGIYLVEHFRHRESHHVTLLRGEKFPVCQNCGFGVMFSLVKPVTALEGTSAPKIVLNEIPDASDPKS